MGTPGLREFAARDCSQRDADKELADIRDRVAAGAPVNELSLIYLPLMRSDRLSPDDIFKNCAALVPKLDLAEDDRMHVAALLLLVSYNVVSKKVMRENLGVLGTMGLKVIDDLEREAREEGREEGRKGLLDFVEDYVMKGHTHKEAFAAAKEAAAKGTWANMAGGA
jgi:hypothetical protein